MAAPFPTPTKNWHTTTYDSISPTLPSLSAAGKTVLITGGGTGIGAETALSFAQAGASRIALLGRREQPLLNTKALIQSKHPQVDVFVASTDVTQKSQVDSAFSQFAGDGKIDVLVSNAAVIGPQDSTSDVDPDKFIDSISTNLRGSLLVAQAFLRYAAKDAVAIDINSNAAHINYGSMFAAYSIAKLAVYRLWDTLVLGNPEMRFYHVQPGVVDTDMNKESGGVKAMGFADDVSLPACFNVWLASPEARFLKGKYLWANWDVDELKARAKEIEEGQEFNIGLVGWPWKGSWKFESKDSAWK